MNVSIVFNGRIGDAVIPWNISPITLQAGHIGIHYFPCIHVHKLQAFFLDRHIAHVRQNNGRITTDVDNGANFTQNLKVFP